MSVVQNLQIASKEKSIIQLEAVQTFISSLIAGGHIENEYTIWIAEMEKIIEINHHYFKDWSVLSELVNPNGELYACSESDLVNSSEPKNYVFKIHLSKKSELFQNLEVFNETNFQHFPIFVLFFHQPIEYTIERDFWADEGGRVDERVLLHTNCVIQASGRNSESPYGLHKEKNYVGFYEYVRKLFGEFEMGVYYT